ncbi:MULTISPECIES: DUF378 domain-containing protein [Clostridium]|uniref:DUF378 domain-containing protein n=3 Tax=Clostridium TaxID=1485 RepID=A0A168L860_9CLOT|nr:MULTISPECIES: DUF378 domain-containing protein [Clostridium]AGY77622.1 DUF378 domain-containing protein [Clostridium autoethanogenum DSM 10061]ALU37762.1 hypothetical protein CLAU_3335 [Clostridium autoethanogenum DSM 10061]OAA82800.1 hypothetical protein WY13_04148 [Clostridium ljungdahlii]OAA94425.1 hypothetical protein WX73_02971 [Clostridium coskatii]OBR93169.1 hypothetical protein CLCOS_26410 [Clostridium coskatii]
MYKLSIIDKVSLILVVIGAINWGLIGLLDFNIVEILFGDPVNLIGRILYILIGTAGIDMIILFFKAKKSYK